MLQVKAALTQVWQFRIIHIHPFLVLVLLVAILSSRRHNKILKLLVDIPLTNTRRRTDTPPFGTRPCLDRLIRDGTRKRGSGELAAPDCLSTAMDLEFRPPEKELAVRFI
jgi:hypothetical protein